MGSFSIWHWVILLFFGVLIFVLIRTAKSTTNPLTGPVGFGGWLLVLAFGQVVSPLRSLKGIFDNVEASETFASVPGGTVVMYGEILLTASFIALQVLVAIAMIKKSARFPRLFTYQWIAMPIVTIADFSLISLGMGIGVNQIITPDLFRPVIVGFIGVGLWTWYVHKSVRVRNTFVH